MTIIKRLSGLIVGVISFIVYMFTIAPSVIQIDPGELAAAQALPGIAHPSGYPLFTIIGYLFSLIPLPFTTIFKMNLLAALWCSAGVAVFVYTVELILDNLDKFASPVKSQTKSPKGKKKEQKEPAKESAATIEIPDLKKYLTASASGFVLAFSKTYWFQSTSVEVYSLHSLMIIITIYFLVKAFIAVENEFRNWYLFSIGLALSFGNHMTTMLILPATAYLFFLKYKFRVDSFKKIGKMLLVFFPVLAAIYSYLPLRAAQNPLLNWGNPVDVERILRHVSGKQYQVWIFSSFDSAKKQLNYFVSNLPQEFSVALILVLIGFATLFFTSKRLFTFILIAFITTVFYSINYDISDIDAYFLLAYVCMAFFSAFGILKVFQMLKDVKLKYTLPVSLVVILVFFQGFLTINKVSQTGNYIFEDYTKAALNSVEKNAIIFTYQWDYFISPSYYFQFVDGIRKDVKIVDKELLRRSWYYNQLNTTFPGITDGIKPMIDQFLEALKPFERGEEFNSQLLENLYRRIMTELITTNIDKHDFYIAVELVSNEMQKGEFVLSQGYTLVPDVFFYRVVKGSGEEYIPAEDPDYEIRIPAKKNYYIDFIKNVCGWMLVKRALYEMQFDNVSRAKVYIKKLKQNFPDHQIPKGLAEVIEK